MRIIYSSQVSRVKLFLISNVTARIFIVASTEDVGCKRDKGNALQLWTYVDVASRVLMQEAVLSALESTKCSSFCKGVLVE